MQIQFIIMQIFKNNKMANVENTTEMDKTHSFEIYSVKFTRDSHAPPK